jgi:protein-tyrosine phosphatase
MGILRSLFILLALFSTSAFAKNLHRIDPPEGAKDTGFAIYRSGKPTFADYEHLVCHLGVTEIFVLSNNGASVEGAFNTREASEGRCPTKQILVHNFDQSVTKHALTQGFLDQFDDWVRTAQSEGKKIAFRCNCGCHRTGRLAAYYQMKYMGLTLAASKKDLYRFAHPGKYPGEIGNDLYWFIVAHPLHQQIRALNDQIYGRTCSTRKKFCVDPSTSAGETTTASSFEPLLAQQD